MSRGRGLEKYQDKDRGRGYCFDVYFFTHPATTTYRSGMSGLYSGNNFGYFDYFSLTSDDIAPVPEPATMFLMGSVFGLLGPRRKFSK